MQRALTEKLIQFRKERNWQKFHSLKNLAASVSIEAAELLEGSGWMLSEELEHIGDTQRENFTDEVADVFIYLLLICEKLEIDLKDATEQKIKKNAKKYPAKHEWDGMWQKPFDKPELL